MKTKIINATAHEFKVEKANGGVIRRLSPRKEITLRSEPNTTYHEYVFKLVLGDNPISTRSVVISSDHCLDFEEIRIHETLSHAVQLHMSKVRRHSPANSRENSSRSNSAANSQHSTFTNTSTVTRDLAAFNALRRDAALRIEAIEISSATLKEPLKQVKVCPAQCHNLVKTCLEGIEQMREDYFVVSHDDVYVWQLYYSKKLKQLTSSSDRLLSTLGSIKDLLQACGGSQWGAMGLALSIPPSTRKSTISKFDVLIKELSWNLDTTRYALDLTGNMQLKWDQTRCSFTVEQNSERLRIMQGRDQPEPEWRRVNSSSEECTKLSRKNVLRWAQVCLLCSSCEDSSTNLPQLNEDSGNNNIITPGGAAMKSGLLTLIQKDRDHFLASLQNGSLLAPKTGFRRLSVTSAADRLRHNFAAVLKKRLQVLSMDQCSVPDCFWINHLDLKIETMLSGENSTKAIYRGKWCGQVVAIGKTRGTTRVVVEREAIIMLKVQHPNVVGFYGCAFTDQASSGNIDDSCTAGYLVMELMQEDLRRVIDRRARIQSGSPFPLVIAVDILLQITAAMIHMHSCDIIHRDLKAANCLVSRRSVTDLYIVKLIDFGNSKMLNSDDAISNHTANSGTRRWMAPEVWGTPGVVMAEYTRSADVYSFGMTCYEVVTGLLPFHECVYNSDLQPVVQEGKRPSFPASVSCPEGLKELLSRCWDQEPSARPTFAEIQKSLWSIKCELELQ